MQTMDFKQAAGRVRNLLAPTKTADLSKSALTKDEMRDRIIRDTGEASARFKAARDKMPVVEYEREHEDGSKTTEQFGWDTYPELIEDIARAAFGWDEPDVLSRDRMQPRYRLNREVLDAFVNSPYMDELRPFSRNNTDESLFGAMGAAPDAHELASGLLAEHIARSEQIGEAEQEQQQANDLFEQLRQQARQETAEHGTAQPDTRRGIKQVLKQAQQANEKLAGLMQQENASSMRVDAIAAGTQMAAAAADAAQAIAELPGTEDGNESNLTFDEALALAEKWNAHEGLRKVIRRLGRLFRSFSFKREARTQHVRIEPVGIEPGNDLKALLPVELARLQSDSKALKALFWRDYEQRRLLQFAKEGKSPAGKGPVIQVQDQSGSMGMEFGGVTRNVWACSLGVTVQARTHREKRAFAGIQFGSRREVRTWYFPKDEPVDPAKVLDYASHFFGGGTDTCAGMEEALRIIKSEPAFTTADVMLVADGQDVFEERDRRVRDALRALGVRITGISIAYPNNAYMKEMCDEVIDIGSLADEEAATTALADSLT